MGQCLRHIFLQESLHSDSDGTGVEEWEQAFTVQRSDRNQPASTAGQVEQEPCVGAGVGSLCHDHLVAEEFALEVQPGE